ncbi:MAG: ribosomal protein S18-alanine N-acetyltransferase [Gammaproteobacteria bacterium]|jgi:ribosomal-protein-alanine N-acetyltransferase
MSAAVEPRTEIRLMLPADLKSVTAIERAAYRYPWSLGIFRDCLLAGYYCIVLNVAGAVTGFAIMSSAAAEAHVLNICVHPAARRFGYGRRLLNALMVKAHEVEVEQIFLEVRPSNKAALGLYRSSGFVEIGVRPAYYQAEFGREDAVVLSATLQQSA